MKKLKSTVTNMVIVLTAVALLSGGVLASVNHITVGPIKEQNAKQLGEGIKAVMDDDQLVVSATDTVALVVDGDTAHYIVHTANNKQGKMLGCAVESTVMGFGGELKVLVGFDKKGKVLGYKILQSAETPGLGQKADKWFQKDGKGCIVGRKMNEKKPLTIGKEANDVDAITASTITSKAFIRAVNNAFSAYRKYMKASEADAVTSASQQLHE